MEALTALKAADCLEEQEDYTLEQRLVLQRAWATATTRPAIVTTIALDGDVTTQIHRSILEDERLDHLMSLHGEGVSASLGWWKLLAGVGVSLLDMIRKGVMGP